MLRRRGVSALTVPSGAINDRLCARRHLQRRLQRVALRGDQRAIRRQGEIARAGKAHLAAGGQFDLKISRVHRAPDRAGLAVLFSVPCDSIRVVPCTCTPVPRLRPHGIGGSAPVRLLSGDALLLIGERGRSRARSRLNPVVPILARVVGDDAQSRASWASKDPCGRREGRRWALVKLPWVQRSAIRPLEASSSVPAVLMILAALFEGALGLDHLHQRVGGFDVGLFRARRW